MKALLAVLLVLAGALAQAQTIYRWVDDKGRVQYSEKPPAGASSRAVEQRVTSVGAQARPGRPEETSAGKAAQKPPVTMYMTDWCPYCRQARQYFQRNGIPFTEHDIEKSQAANAEYKRLGGRGVPLILVGAQRMSGFSEPHMAQMLKAAGY